MVYKQIFGSLLSVILLAKLCASESITFVNSVDARPKREVDKFAGPKRFLIFPEGSNVQV